MSDFKPVEPLISPFGAPVVYPKANTHPRILVTPSTLGRVRMNLTHPDHAQAYSAFLKSAAMPYAYPDVFEYSADVLESIANKALKYLLLEDRESGVEAVNAILHLLRSFNITPRHDICRYYGHIMYTAARVYDWAFDLIAPDEREEIVSRCEYSLGPYFEVGFPPEKQGMVTGHGSEMQMFRDWLSLGIAAYDEHPDIYYYVAGRLEEQAVPPRAYYFKSGSHWQGSAYGPSRFACELFCDLLFYEMTDEKYHIFTTDMEKAAISFLCHMRADGEMFRDGDDFADKFDAYNWSGKGAYTRNNTFVASALYRNPVLRDHAFSFEGLPFGAADILLVDDPSIGKKNYKDNLPRVHYMGSPRGQYVAHTKEGASVYFKVGESHSANHEWKDSGNFMIFYKGSLASAANCYEYTSADGTQHNYGSKLDLFYNKQTVSTNCMLVWDNNEFFEERWGYSGGQRQTNGANGESNTLAQWMSKSTIDWAKVLAHAAKTDRYGFLDYCMLMGDLTNAYTDKIKDYKRTSIAIATGIPESPLSVFIFDRLVTRDPAAEKTWQMHTMGEYSIEGQRAITRHPSGGVLVCDTLLPENARLGVIGNAQERFIVNGENLAEPCDPKVHPKREDGRGRLTVSPTKPEERELFLNAMYVTSAGVPTDAKAELISGDGFVAAELFDKIVLFPTDEELDFVTVDHGNGKTLYATNLTPGKWTDGNYGFVVEESEKMLVVRGFGKKTYRRICR